jgi:hypothetical protein
MLDGSFQRKKVGLPSTWCTAAHIDGCYGWFVEHEDRCAGCQYRILRIADLDSGYVGNKISQGTGSRTVGVSVRKSGADEIFVNVPVSLPFTR